MVGAGQWGGKGCGKEIVREYGTDPYTALYFKWITCYKAQETQLVFFDDLDG